MSQKYFRPPLQNDEGSDSDEADDDDDDDDIGNIRGKKTNNKNVNLSDDESEQESEKDDDNDDEDDEEQEDVSNKKKRKEPSTVGGKSRKETKKPKIKTSSFFDMEAEDSGDDDDDEEDGYRGNKKLDGEQMDHETMEIIRQQDRRRAQGGGLFGEGRSVADISKEIEDRHRYSMNRRTVDRVLDRPPERRVIPSTKRPGGTGAGASSARESTGGNRNSSSNGAVSSIREDVEVRNRDIEEDVEPAEVYTAAVAQQSLVPSVSDPSLWMVSCLPGKEQELVFQIMNKCVAQARLGRPLGISAAIAAQSKGKIYIESFSEPAVLEALNGVRGLMQYTMKLVPIGDMTTVMTVVSKKKPVKKNEWVRMTRGHYKGDLALVKAVKESGLKCIVQYVPRLDLALNDLPPEEARLRRKTIRPPQKFFNSVEVGAMGKQTLKRQRFPGLDIFCDYFEGNYFQDGYMIKEMTVGSMVKPCSDEDLPSLDELQSFQRRKQKSGEEDEAEENEGSRVAASLLDELSELQGKTGLTKATSDGGLLIGDTVEVIEGDLVGMRGKLVSLDGSTVKVKPSNANIDLGGTNEVEFLSNQVRKYIPVGAHVKVTDGRYANETGVVVAVEQLEGETDFTAVVLTDVTNKEISVRTSQLRESAEVASGQDKLSGYELYDLVVLSGGGSANEVGVIVRVGREDFTVINNHGLAREVRPEELRGKRNSTSTRAVALDVQGNQIRCGDSVNIAEGPHKGKTASIKRMSRAQLFLHSQTRTDRAGIFVVRSRSCVLSGSKSQTRSAGADMTSPYATPQAQAGRGPAGARGKRDDGLVGKTVRVQAGQWKGYIGSVTDSTATHVQVELHSRLKKVMVVRDKVAVVGDKFGATNNFDSSGTNESMAAPHLLATPLHAVGGATPAIHSFGGATPSHDTDNNDEVWRPGGSIDQDASKDDGWGTTTNDRAIGFDSSANDDNDGGWGSSKGASSTWGASTNNDSNAFSSNGTTAASVAIKEEYPPPAAIKREPLKSEMETTEVSDADETPVWFMERVCVKLKDSSKAGVIKEINPDKSAVVEFDDGSSQTVRVSEVVMIPPAEHDTVLVTGGNELGLEGSLVCVDGKFLHYFQMVFVFRLGFSNSIESL